LRIRKAGLSPQKIEAIFITHWHGDHVLGIPGLLQSMDLNGRKKDLLIFGPVGTNEFLFHMLKCCAYRLGFKLKINEIPLGYKGTILKEKEFQVSCIYLKHDIPCLAYAFETYPYRNIRKDFLKKEGIRPGKILRKLKEGKPIRIRGKLITPEEATYVVPGKKIVYITDTDYCDQIFEIAKDSTLLIIESTYLSKDRGEETEKMHLDSKQAGEIGKIIKPKLLVLTHFSQRYKDTRPLLEEAKKEYDKVVAGADFMKIKIDKEGKIEVINP